MNKEVTFSSSHGFPIDQIRSHFPHTGQGRLYMNHAGTAPMCIPVVKAVTDYYRDRSEGKIETYQQDLPILSECKSMLATMVNAESAERIAMIPNTSEGINIVAGGIPWKAGDRILLGRTEFPANVWPYINLKRLGVEIDFLSSGENQISPGQIDEHITKRTRLVALSAVQFLSGFRADLESIGTVCRSRGALFVVDAIQAIGAVRIDVQSMHIDALAAGGQKWQLSPHGTGFLYVSEQVQAEIQQTSLGWLAVENPWNFSDFTQPLAPSARRYEGGSLNFPGIHGYHAALSLLAEVGPQNIEERIFQLTRRLIEGFSTIPGFEVRTPREKEKRAGIVTVRPPGNSGADALFRKLLAQKLHAAVREGMLRFSPHFYMTEEEMDKAADILRESLRSL